MTMGSDADNLVSKVVEATEDSLVVYDAVWIMVWPATADWSMTAESGLTRYLEEIRRFPMLEPQEEYMLAKRWREHGDRDAAHKLVTGHLRLVAKTARGYGGYGLPITEVISEGNVGLMQAITRFEPEKGFRLAEMEVPVANTSKEAARNRAEAEFKKKAQNAREGEIAAGQYKAAGLAVREKTARLRALRLAKEATEMDAQVEKTPVTEKKTPSI